MTVAETTSQTRNDYIGNGIATVFNFTFEVLAETNSAANRNFTIRVLLTASGVETEQVEDTDYTVALNADTRLGAITFITAPTTLQSITFLSDIPETQSTDYINIGTGKFPADSHEGTVDKLTLIIRQLSEQIARSILLDESSQLTDVTIPVSVANANKAIVVNNAGDNLAAKNLADIGTFPVTDFAATFLDDENAAEVRTTLDAQKDVITTRGDIIRGSSSGVAERLAIGAANTIVVSDGTDVAYQATPALNAVNYINVPSTKLAGDIVQTVFDQDGEVATGTTTLPNDDTIPQNTEGNEFLTKAITPTNASNLLKIDVVVFISHNAANSNNYVALFQDSTVGALAATGEFDAIGTAFLNLKFTHFMTAGTTSATTFKIRAGSDKAGTMTFNGTGGSRKMGGILASSITITEIKV